MGNQTVALLSVSDGAARAFSSVVGGRTLHLQYVDGKFVDDETSSVWNYDGIAISGPMKGSSLHRLVTETAFWFAWSAFFPDTQIYGMVC